MIITARQLEDLHRNSGGNGQLTLPYRARLTPLAVDWVRSKKIILGYSSVAAPSVEANGGAAPLPAVQESAPQSIKAGAFLYWCDGPCGPAKAAVVAHERESSLRAIDKPADVKQIVPILKSLAAEVKSGRAAGGILLVQAGATAMVFANRCPSLRAVLGTCLESVEQGISQMAANVLVIEYPHKTLQQVKNMLSRFTRGGRPPSEEVLRQLQELATCG